MILFAPSIINLDNSPPKVHRSSSRCPRRCTPLFLVLKHKRRSSLSLPEGVLHHELGIRCCILRTDITSGLVDLIPASSSYSFNDVEGRLPFLQSSHLLPSIKPLLVASPQEIFLPEKRCLMIFTVIAQMHSLL